jgi:hypothetical protein
MIITAPQARTILGVGKKRLTDLIADGLLTPVNPKKPDALKWFMRFDSAEVNRLRRGSDKPVPNVRKGGVNGHAMTAEIIKPAPAVPAASGLLTKLAAIEDKLDRLLAIWS